MIKDIPNRWDYLKNLKNVSKELIKDPTQTQKVIAKKLGITEACVSEKVKKLETIGQKNDKILYITDKDLEIVYLGQAEIRRRLTDAEELSKMRTYEIASVIEKSERRYQIFRWEVTDKEGGLKNIKLTEEEKKKMLLLLN